MMRAELVGDFCRLEGGSSSVGKSISDLVPQKFRFYEDKTWYLHKKFVTTVLPYLIDKYGIIDVSALPPDMRAGIKAPGALPGKAAVVCPYKTLWLQINAPACIIDAAWKAVIKNYHPDVGGDPEHFLLLKSSYEEIKNGKKHT